MKYNHLQFLVKIDLSVGISMFFKKRITKDPLGRYELGKNQCCGCSRLKQSLDEKSQTEESCPPLLSVPRTLVQVQYAERRNVEIKIMDFKW
jgi:hypothetical protein